MRRVTLVRRRDGETVPFDESRIADAIERALAAAGTRDPRLAGEIASVVGLFLEKTFWDEVPDVEQVEDMVEKVLLDTGHASAAKAFILHRERRSRIRAARATRDGYAEPTLFDPRAILVDDTAAGVTTAYSREAIARTLALDGLVPRRDADDVAASVEERLRRAGVARAPASLVRGLAEAEVLARDAPVDLRRRGAAVLPPETIEAALHRRPRPGEADPWPSPVAASLELGGLVLRSHALSELLPPEVARAHLDGDVHVHGLARPSALFSACFSPDDVRRGLAPGTGVRHETPGGARLAAATGRAARALAASATNRTALVGTARAFAPLCADRTAEQIAEDAWLLLHETCVDAGGSRLELDATPIVAESESEPPAIAASGDETSSVGQLGGVATAFASSLLRAYARGTGLPPRETFPVPNVGLGEASLADPAARAAMRTAAEIALRGERVVFTMLREGAAGRAASVARASFGAGAACAGRVTLNLPRAACRAGRGNVEGFLRECDRLVELAVLAHVTRRELLALVATAPGGALAPLFRGARGRAALYDFAAATWSIGVTGINEALVHLTGFELHEGDEEVSRIARRLASYLAIRVKAAGLASDLPTTLDADEDPEVARRLLALDRAREPEGTARVFASLEAYTPGSATRPSAPIDLFLRIEREESLHAYLATATLALELAARDCGGTDGVVALLAKCLRAGTCRRVELALW